MDKHLLMFTCLPNTITAGAQNTFYYATDCLIIALLTVEEMTAILIVAFLNKMSKRLFFLRLV